MERKIHNFVEIKNLKDMLKKTGQMYAKYPAFKFKTEQEGKFKIITHEEYRNEINSLGTALINMGLKGKRIAVISDNRYEWTVAYLAICCGTGVVVPLDKSLPEQEIENLLIRSKVQAIFYSDKYTKTMEKIKAGGKTNLLHYISMDLDKSNSKVLSQKALTQKGEMLVAEGNTAFIDAEIDEEEMSFMLFTSGTTALSKAVALSHKNICTNIMDIASVIELTPEDTLLSFLPLHHTFECTVGFLYPIYKGATIAYCEGIRYIADNIREYQITAMISVPILFENMYKKVMKGIKKQGKYEKVQFGIKLTKFFLKFKIDLRKRIFKDIHSVLGGKVRLFVNGAAALDKETEIGFNNLGFKIVQGYGLTETSPVISAGNDRHTKIGSVGKVFPSFEIKIDNPNETGIGEIVVKGNSVMLGYYENAEATNEVLKDGWFHTGDLGYLDEEDYLFITGRKKNVIVLKNGKNIYPEELEAKINKIDGIKESIVYGKPESSNDADLKLCAKIVYDKETVKEEYGLNTESEILDKIWDKIKEINKTMPTYKYIREITLTEQELIKTTTQKIKRHEELAKILGK